MATLYTHRDANIRKTWALFTAFLLVVIAIGWAASYIWNDQGILIFAVLFSSVMSFAGYWWSDRIVLGMSHAVPVSEESGRELYRLVENLAITAGLPTPKIYLIDEEAPNAFATGRDPGHAVIAVTRGLINRLSKTELEGVLAHELSHVGNRDTLLQTAVVVLVGFISLVADFFTRSMFFGRRSSNSENRAGGVFMLIGVVLMILAPIVARLMQLSISRKREFLADASGALLTRYPEGLASALEKISRDATPLRAARPVTAHLWFDDPYDKPGQKMPWLAKLFLTHPPVEERIKALRGREIS